MKTCHEAGFAHAERISCLTPSRSASSRRSDVFSLDGYGSTYGRVTRNRRHSSGAFAGNFLVGGALVALLQPLLARKKTTATDESSEAAIAAVETPGGSDWLSPLRGQLSLDSPLLQFTIVRAGRLARATLIGWYLFDAHPYWAAFVAFAITKTDPTELVAVGIHRAVGTVIGAAVAVELLRNVNSRPC